MLKDHPQEIYRKLLALHGRQGWWPINGRYHPKNYLLPSKSKEIFEVAIGAILTQNTAWKNVELALKQLHERNLLGSRKILSTPQRQLAKIIRSSGYFNQKAKKLKIFSKFFLSLRGKKPTREALLNLWGIGPETADSILLYAYKVPSFVVDSYTKRIFCYWGIFKKETSYEQIKLFFQDNLPSDATVFNEYHALIVEHAKKYYSNKPYGKNCPLTRFVC